MVVFLFFLKLLVEILMRPTLTMQKKKPKRKQDCLLLVGSLDVFTLKYLIRI